MGKEKDNTSASVAMVASIPELIVSEQVEILLLTCSSRGNYKNSSLLGSCNFKLQLRDCSHVTKFSPIFSFLISARYSV